MKTVFFGANPSIVKWAYTDIINNPEIEYCDFVHEQEYKLQQILFSRKLQNILLKSSICVSKSLYSFLLKYQFLKTLGKDDAVIFIFTCQYQYFFHTSFFTFISFLKKRFKRAKFAFYFNDIIETCYPEALPHILKEFDWVLTFDKAEAEKYNLIYYGEVCSRNHISIKYDIEPFDVFFVGSDRGRIDMILEMFNRLIIIGKRCRFYLYDILPTNRHKVMDFIVNHSGIPLDEDNDEFDINGSYLSINNYCPYPKTLWLIQQSKCLLEIVLPGQSAGSLRTPEANIYHKKLITNCKSITTREFYNSNNICFFEKPEDITKDFFSKPYVEISYDFSPLRLIDFLKRKTEPAT